MTTTTTTSTPANWTQQQGLSEAACENFVPDQLGEPLPCIDFVQRHAVCCNY